MRQIEDVMCSQEVRDFTETDWVLLALAALDQASISPGFLARAYRDAKGDEVRILKELCLPPAEER